MSAAPPIMAVQNVVKRFGGFTALNDVTTSFAAGRLTSVIGPNGAGKSTFFNVLSGSFPPTEGRVFFNGTDITGTPQHKLAHMGIAKSFQITSLFPKLTVQENVRIAAQAMRSRFGLWQPRSALNLSDAVEALLLRVGLQDRRHESVDTLAHGQQRSLEIAVALACEPKLLLLDEPTAGMSPEEAREMMDLILKLNAERTVILVEHRMKLVMGISDRIVVLHHGTLLAEGTADDIRRHDEVKRVYLGQSV
ncbi:ABC transporter ATP-binding protein [Aquabacter spiritensis]|uniref:Amino acid/amide ABC transporter ATP-binding protein 1 (HAAT family) n=1 Tax=Aquabacter spiritensis TaxID=933073 RepID=A0A4R3LYW8_9HYPH|nr:ABC transporter ATP-binding protein [Aquabacter spiritensis]TCT05673.1 amino acid/amide ABC transporter ATP-binding protein 1 (HAAT family) [Aquabacter spiritensis]